LANSTVLVSTGLLVAAVVIKAVKVCLVLVRLAIAPGD